MEQSVQMFLLSLMKKLQRWDILDPIQSPVLQKQLSREFLGILLIYSMLWKIFPNRSYGPVRAKRNQLLSECDWVMCVDTPGESSKNNIKEWEKYRQRLRDLTTEQTDPSSITWPFAPNIEGVQFDADPVEEIKLRHRVEDLGCKNSILTGSY